MDVCCDLLIPEIHADPELVRLGNSLDEYRYGPHLRLSRRPIPMHVAARLPESLRTLESYAIHGDGIDLLDYEVNGREPDWRGPTFSQLLLSQLADRRPWAFVFEWHCDQIDDVFAVADVAALIEHLRANLDWKVERRGFIAYSL